MTKKDIKNLLKSALEKGMEKLENEDVLAIEIPKVIEGYKPNHAKGVLLPVLHSGQFSDSEVVQNIVSDEDIKFGIIIVSKNFGSGMEPEDYIDFVFDTLAGIELNINRAQRQIAPISYEWIKEEDGYWWYSANVLVPNKFFEKSIRDI